MSKNISRRKFLHTSLLAGAMVTLTACPVPEIPPTPIPDPTPVPATPVPPTPVPVGPKVGGTLNFAEAGAFNNFNPWNMTAVNRQVYNVPFNRLLYKDRTGKEIPDIAESWDLADDGLTLTLKLREDVKWHDGKQCTAEDFVTMFGYTKDEDLVQRSLSVSKIERILEHVKDVKATDAYSLEMTFTQPTAYYAELLDYWYAIRIDDMADPEFMDTPPVGTGPFVFKEWVPEQYARYEKNTDYFDGDLPYLDELRFNRLDRPETLIPNLEAGAADAILMTALADVGRLEADPRFVMEFNDLEGSIFNLIVNTKLPPFDKKEVRQALSLSLNREAMVQTAFFGVSDPITSPFYSPASLGYREDLVTLHAFDLDKAANLLEEAGVTDLETTIHTTPRWPQMQLFCLIWQSDLAKIGIKLNVVEVETARFYEIADELAAGKWDLHPWLVGRTTRDPAIFFGTQTIYRGDPTVNRYKWEHPELEQLVAEGSMEIDTEKRRAMYQRCNEILVEELPMIQVATNPYVYSMHTYVNDLYWDLLGVPRFDKAWLDK